jgi:hypothetical protein
LGIRDLTNRNGQIMRPARTSGILGLLLALSMGTAQAHNGKLDGNGCHYVAASGRYHCHRAAKPNQDVKAPVKKSRSNVCHAEASSNYSTLKYFVSYPSMAACVSSGGREAQ